LNKRVLIMLPVLLIAAYLAFFGDKTPNNGVAEPVARPATRAINEQPTNVAAAPAAEEHDSQSRDGIARLATRDALKTELASHDDADIFALALSEAPPTKPTVAPPPPPPPVPFVFVGKKYEDGKWTVFFEHDNRISIAQEGSTVEGFHVDAIRPNEIELTDSQVQAKHIIPTPGG
jgi:hypothetical protein